jgi:hypothetical protein
MELFSFSIGVIATALLFVLAMRRAKKKPEGKSAKIINVLSGGGGSSPVIPR